MKLESHFRFIAQTIAGVLSTREYFGEDAELSFFKDETAVVTPERSNIGVGLMSPPDAALRLNLQAAQASDDCGFEEICYGFFVQVGEPPGASRSLFLMARQDDNWQTLTN
jgi:hypothetical protein